MSNVDPFAAAGNFLSGGLTAAKWPTVGFVVEGTVTNAAMAQQRDFDSNELLVWNDGNPRMQLVVDLQSEATGWTWKGLRNTKTPVPNDDGMRAAYFKGNMQKALTKALRDAGGAKFEKGGHMRIERIADVPNPDPKKQDALDFAITWTPATANTAPIADFLAEPEGEAADTNPFAGKPDAPF